MNKIDWLIDLYEVFDKSYWLDFHQNIIYSNTHVNLQVVDARAGPGTKSMYKIKNRNKELPEDHSIMKKKHKHKHKHRKRPTAAQIHDSKAPGSPGGCSDDFIGMSLLISQIHFLFVFFFQLKM